MPSIASVLHSWTAQSAEPLGVVAFNDLNALGVISAAAAHGLQIPHELGVVGTDDGPVAALARPSLSSVRFDLASEATGIAMKIAAAVGHETDLAASTGAVVEVVARESTAKAGG